ncbi:MAG: adenylosuccinate synthetase, partial [candidate division NC10 bacterium]|nr:adenylosuccinate synthetase [candidate division NC10 bacterium]
MANVIVVGTQWGDEGKGKIVDLLSEYFDAVARYQGGSNAGHTVVVEEEKIVLHLVPSGVLRKGKVCILGNGVVIDLTALIQEMDQLGRLHVKIEENFFISKNAHLVLPYHAILDAELERLREGRQIGTTRRGIGPAYVDKMARTGIRVGDLADRDFFKERLRNNLEEKRVQFPHHQELQELDYEKMAAEQLEQFERVR